MTKPLFTDANHPQLLPDWLKKSLDELLAALGDDFDRGGMSFWVDHHYCDEHSYTPRGDLYIRIKGLDDEDKENRLDHIPAVRRMERKANTYFENLPIGYDSEANTLGEIDHSFEPGKIEFVFTDDGCDLAEIRMVAEFVDGKWLCYDEIVIYADISESLRATATAERLAEAIDPEAYGFRKWPKVISGKIDPDDDSIHLRFEPGLTEGMDKADG